MLSRIQPESNTELRQQVSDDIDNAQPRNPRQESIKPSGIIYTVQLSRRSKSVQVTVWFDGVYDCPCGSFQLYAGCDHVERLQAVRKAQGRKF